MKYTNKDAKVRIYDGTFDGTEYTIDSVADAYHVQLFIDPDPGWTPNQYQGAKIIMTSGDADGKVFIVSTNESDIINLWPNPSDTLIAAGDTFKIASPFYFEFCLDNGDFSAPTGNPDHEQTLIMSRNKFTDCSHYIINSDATVLEPLQLTFSVMMNDSQKFLDLLDWLEGNTVNGNTVVSTKGTAERFHTTDGIQFRDSGKKTVDVQYYVTGGGKHMAYEYGETYFDLGSLTFTEAEDGVNLTMTGMVYGNITPMNRFSPGTDVTA